jgi:hypothetical protein
MSLKNPVTPLGVDPGTVRLATQRLNQYATPGPRKEMLRGMRRRKVKLIGYIWRRNYILKHVVDGKIEGRI